MNNSKYIAYFVILKIILLITLLFSVYVRAQTNRFTNYTLVDGLSQSFVPHILEDNNGYLWMSTEGGGINQFNGITFKPITTFDGLSNNKIITSYQDSSGILWIGTANGLNSYNGKTISNYQYGSSDKPLVISNITSDANGRLIIATTKGLFTVKDEVLIPIDIGLKFDYLNFLIKDKKGDFWYGISNEIHHQTNGKLKTFSSKNGLGGQRIIAATIMPNGEPLAACYGRKIYIKNGNKFAPFLPNSNIHQKYVSSLFVDTKQHLWIGTINNGIYKVNLTDSSIVRLTTANGLANNHIETIMEDSWGNIWIGTGGGGVSKYHNVAFSQITSKNGLPGDWIYSTLSASNGNMWIAAGTNGVSLKTDSTQTDYNRNNGFVNAKVRILFEDRDQRVWLCPEGKGLWVYDSVFHKIQSDIERVEFDHIKSISQDTSGNFWVCEGGKGLLKFQYQASDHTIKSINHIRKRDGLPSDYIYTLHTDQINRLWYGTKSSGSGYILNGKITELTVKDGLASNSICMISEDKDGYIWLAGGDGISRLAAFKSDLDIQKIGFKDGLTGIPVFQIISDPSGFLWAGTSNGVTRFNRTNGTLTNPKHFGYNEGFTGLETNSNAVCITKNNQLYFGTGTGLMVFEGETTVDHPTMPKLILSGINLFYEPLDIKFPTIMGNWSKMVKDINLTYAENNLSFKFFGVDLNNPEKLLYSWMMEGFDRDWSPASKLTEATYSNLPPGEYIFKVKAQNSEGVWSQEVTSRTFFIAEPPPPPPPFYQKTWFIATVSIVGCIILILIAFIVYMRLKRERERIKMERNLLELEQKALRLQMNPHFIFNALNSIQSLITTNDSKKARYQLAKFSKLMRQILDNSREQTISLEDEMATLNNYMTIEKFSSGNQFDFKVSCSDNIIPEDTAIPPMMIQPFTENAIIHGMKHIKHSGLIIVNFSLDDNYLKCTIDDNGIGRKAAGKIKSQIAQQHKSAALIVTQERLHILHGSKNDKNLEIIDKLDGEGNSTGTCVTIHFPHTLLE